MTTQQFSCHQCGADLTYDPSASAQKCPYCGAKQAIEKSAEVVEELDFMAHLKSAGEAAEAHESTIAQCDTCGAQSTFDANVAAQRCPFCDSSLITTGGSRRTIKPRSLLPFAIAHDQAKTSFQQWLRSRWFAPNELKKRARADKKMNGIYVPYWTYDSDTASGYSGERGDAYYETETYTEWEDGKSVTKTRQVRKIRWTYVTGHVSRSFDDVLILATESLPRKYADKLEPWDLPNLVPYSNQYISGFRAEMYQLDLSDGFTRAQVVMDDVIRSDVRSDIGGDEQRIHSVNTAYNNITFKHILLPIWLSAYRYSEKVYLFLVNGRTGEVQGERPYSWIKITLFTIAVLGAIGGAYALFTM
jgi:predicted RNA-binding Zn-ribbon protein involved in translation (DUF1610 family)